MGSPNTGKLFLNIKLLSGARFIDICVDKNEELFVFIQSADETEVREKLIEWVKNVKITSENIIE